MAATSTVKRIVCLANSRKEKDRCIAGKEFLPDGRPGGWIRPVSQRSTQEVSKFERQYKDRGEPLLLDVIDVPVIEPQPLLHQKENWLLDQSVFWKKVHRITRDELEPFTDESASLWIDGYRSESGWNNRVPTSHAGCLEDSLRLIKVDRLEVSVSQKKCDGRFRYDGQEYKMRITDPAYEEEYVRLPKGSYALGDCFLTISLTGEPYKGHFYKLIAAIIEPSEPLRSSYPNEEAVQVPLFTI